MIAQAERINVNTGQELIYHELLRSCHAKFAGATVFDNWGHDGAGPTPFKSDLYDEGKEETKHQGSATGMKLTPEQELNLQFPFPRRSPDPPVQQKQGLGGTERPIVITLSKSPFMVIHVHPILENMWGIKDADIIDKPLQDFCATEEDISRMQMVADQVQRSSKAMLSPVPQLEQHQVFLSLRFPVFGSSQFRVISNQFEVEPFSSIYDPSQLQDIKYLVWFPKN